MNVIRNEVRGRERAGRHWVVPGLPHSTFPSMSSLTSTGDRFSLLLQSDIPISNRELSSGNIAKALLMNSNSQKLFAFSSSEWISPEPVCAYKESSLKTRTDF